jgi:fermentation-respiration switch protein FrsA (DUF1100 family)
MIEQRQWLKGTFPLRALLNAPVRRVAGIMFLAAAVLMGAVVAFGFLLSAPARAVIGPAPLDLHAEPIAIPSTSGAILSGWFVAGRPGTGAVVLMHGFRRNRLSMIERARLLSAAGLSVLLFDFQAHGESTGSRITFGRLESLDARAAVAFMQRRLPGERIGAVGTSLGGAAALLGPGSLPVDALVLESVYPDLVTATANRIRSVLGPVLSVIFEPTLTELFKLLLPVTLNLNLEGLRPIDRIAEVTAPVLVISGTSDAHTRIGEARAMFDRARDPKLFWAVHGAGHVDLEAFAASEYRDHVLPFLIDKLR